jgi:hypothetical protein
MTFCSFLSCALEIHVPSFYDRHDKRKNVMVFTLFFCFNLDVESTAKMFGLLHMMVHCMSFTHQIYHTKSDNSTHAPWLSDFNLMTQFSNKNINCCHATCN